MKKENPMQSVPATVYELLAMQEPDETGFGCRMSECVDTEALSRFVLDVVHDVEPSAAQVDRAIAALIRYREQISG